MIGRATLTSIALLAASAGCNRETPPAMPAVESVAERGPLRLVVRATPTEVLLGDPIEVTVTARGPAEQMFRLPDAAAFGELTVRAVDPPPATRSQPDGSLLWERRFVVESFTAGELEIPPLVAKYGRKPADGAAPTLDNELATGTIKVTVRSALTSQDAVTKPRDITALADVPRKPWTAWQLAALCGGLALAIAALWLAAALIRARLLRPPPPVSPEVWALRALADLERRDLFAADRQREFYYAVSEIVRRYIELKFGLRAPEMTTEEFLSRLARDAAALPYDAGKLREFMATCDLVKYAAVRPSREDGAAALGVARSFVDSTAAAVAASASAAPARPAAEQAA